MSDYDDFDFSKPTEGEYKHVDFDDDSPPEDNADPPKKAAFSSDEEDGKVQWNKQGSNGATAAGVAAGAGAAAAKAPSQPSKGSKFGAMTKGFVKNVGGKITEQLGGKEKMKEMAGEYGKMAQNAAKDTAKSHLKGAVDSIVPGAGDVVGDIAGQAAEKYVDKQLDKAMDKAADKLVDKAVNEGSKMVGAQAAKFLNDSSKEEVKEQAAGSTLASLKSTKYVESEISIVKGGSGFEEDEMTKVSAVFDDDDDFWAKPVKADDLESKLKQAEILDKMQANAQKLKPQGTTKFEDDIEEFSKVGGEEAKPVAAKAKGFTVPTLKQVNVAKDEANLQGGLEDDDSFKGYMSKQQPDFFKSWQKRYWVLGERMLKYYKSEEDYDKQQPPKGIINFQQVRVDFEFLELEQKINLKIKGSKRVFNLKCMNPAEFEQWQRKLKHSIERSIGFKKDISMETYQEDLFSNFKFWRFLRVTEEAFLNQAQTGDVILFTRKKLDLNISNRDNKEYAKVYVIFRLENPQYQGVNAYEVNLLRVDNIMNGEIFQNWEDFKGVLRNAPADVLYRPLYFNRDEAFLQRVQKFTEEIQQQPFIEFIQPTPEDPFRKMKRTYKSQEVAAKFFSHTELFTNEQCYRPHDQYLPDDFSQKMKGSLKLNAGAQLGDEQNVMVKGIALVNQ